ncbi:MAG: DUF2785 domain-containing protein [Acidobacteria bacterium]|nr:DUF2785 domain-containing protein [Acidobacteriota bacterium]MBV9476547.1 DUF2785 domain-containing protein [Acidobacteriota bacterium]
MRVVLAWIVLSVAATNAFAAARHTKPFWKAIVDSGFAVPAGEQPGALVMELTADFSSPDPVLRDDYAYSILAQWVYAKRLFTPAELRSFIAAWTARLRVGLDDHRVSAVLGRSFSALALSTVAALDNEQPFLEKLEFDALLGHALAYLHDERDLRGFDDRAGWLHATAHTADLLKFLARSRHLDPEQQPRIFAALVARLDSADVAFAHGEETRLARAALSLFVRADFDATVGHEVDRRDRRSKVRGGRARARTARQPRTLSHRALRPHRH